MTTTDRKNLSFVIDMTKAVNDRTAKFYKERVIENADNLGLTIAGLDYPPVRSGISQATYGNLLTVGTAPNHDMEWVRRPEFACEKGYKPVLDIIEDYNKIIEKMVRYAEAKNVLRIRSGAKVTFHDGFVKVGTEIITFEELDEILNKAGGSKKEANVIRIVL